MDEDQINDLADYRKQINEIGGKYAQARYFLKFELPKDVQKRLYSKTRLKQNIEVRRKTIVLLRDHFQLTYPAIADLLGYNDHTSVMHHYHKAKRPQNASSEEGK